MLILSKDNTAWRTCLSCRFRGRQGHKSKPEQSDDPGQNLRAIAWRRDPPGQPVGMDGKKLQEEIIFDLKYPAQNHSRKNRAGITDTTFNTRAPIVNPPAINKINMEIKIAVGLPGM